MRTRKRGRGPENSGSGLGTLLLGFILAVAGGYLLTNQVQVGAGPFGGWAWFGPNSFGLLLVPLLVGVALLAFNPKLLVARLLTAAGAVILLASVLDTLRITFRPTSLFLTLLTLGMLVVGLGLLGRGVLNGSSRDPEDRYELDLLEVPQPESQLPHARKRSLPSAPSPDSVTVSARSVDEELAESRAKKGQQD